MTENFEKVYTFVSRIPKGKVVTYTQISKAVGLESPRVVGNILHKNIDPDKIPCHRVVNSKGEISKSYAFGGKKIQIRKLKSEGAYFLKNDKVDLVLSLWNGVY